MSDSTERKADTAARSAVAAPGPIQRAGTFFWQLDRQDATGVNLWSGQFQPNNGYSAEYADKAAALFAAAPDLLAIAEEYLSFLWSEWHSHMSQAEFDADPTVGAVRAAIKKARGQ